jgi:hypothetical protein
MSPRLSAPAIVALLAKTWCNLIIFTNLKAKVEEVKVFRDVKSMPMITRAKLNFEGAVFEPSNYDTASWSHSFKICFI